VMVKKATAKTKRSSAKAKAATEKKAGAKGHKLVVVESPAKARTISRMLGKAIRSGPPWGTSGTCPRSGWAWT